MKEFKVGDKVECKSRGADTKTVTGTVVAILYREHAFPIVVEHESFDKRILADTITQRFSTHGKCYGNEYVTLKHQTQTVVCNIYDHGSYSEWWSAPAALKSRGTGCIGYLTAERDSDGNIFNVVYTTLEK